MPYLPFLSIAKFVSSAMSSEYFVGYVMLPSVIKLSTVCKEPRRLNILYVMLPSVIKLSTVCKE